MRAQRLLLAALVVVLVATGAVVWAATSTGDGDSPEVLSSSKPSDDVAPSSAPAITTPPQQDPQPAEPDQSAAPSDTDSGGAPAPIEPKLGDGNPPSKGTQKTHFKREPKAQQQNDKPGRSFAVPPAQQFSGEGNASLGTVDVKANSLLKWKARGRLEIRFGREAFPIVAPTKSGQLVLPPFLFTKVRVLAGGPWTITISPQ